GIWLVKHYSPFCPHCRRMAPEWKRMTDEMAEDMAAEGITFAEVNCIDSRKLCDSNHVDGYPTINLFVDGKFIEEMVVRYEYSFMKDYIGADNGSIEAYGSDSRTADAEASPAAVEAAPSDNTEDDAVYNQSGQVVVLTKENFAKETAEGPWFVKFYAPWCPHCQTLAPVWEQVSERLKGRVNVGKVNCDENGKLCAEHNVQGFPTLQLLWEGEPTVFKGSRDLENMVNFVDTMMAQPREIKSAEELQKLKSENDVAFMFAYDKADTSARTKAALAHVTANIRKLFLSKQLGIIADAGIARAVVPDMQQSLPVLMAFKDGRTMTYTGTITADDQLREWLYAERFPLLPEFTRENADSLFYDSDYLVLGIVNFASGRELADEYRDNVRAAAMEYQRLTDHKKGGVTKHASVRFAWLDGGEWESYIGRVFRIQRTQLPAVVIVQPSEDHFFTLNARGQPIEPTRAGVLAAVRAAVDGKLQAQSTKSFLARGVK
ncbi:thioredoxin-like protein, partial [Coemansia reversa NRRL 1564]